MASSAADDPAFFRAMDDLRKATAALTSKNAALQRAIDRAVNSSSTDVAKVDGQLKTLLSACLVEVGKVQQSAKLVDNFMKLRPKLTGCVSSAECDLAQAAVNKYVDLRGIVHTRAAKNASKAGAARGAAARAAAADDEEDDDSESQLTEKQQLIRPGQDLNAEIEHQRRLDMEEVADNVADIKEIFHHINMMVNEQGEGIQVISANVEAAEENTERGVDELRKAREMQSSTRSRYLLIAILIGLFLLGIIVFAVH